MKTQYYRGDPVKLKSMLEEYLMIGYDAELVNDELVVYYGKRPKHTKHTKAQDKTDRWSKRERNFGYTRG